MMGFRLQLFGFDQSAYQRPNQKWVCGWASEGTPCHRGPDAHGKCCGGFACQPIQNDSRWVCTRSTAAGGACPQGPLPDGTCCQSIVSCQPVRSLRAKRGLVVSWTFALTTGILLLGFAHWQRFMSPGPVSNAHAPLLATGAGCVVCHAAPHNWMTALDRDRAADSALCLKCHQSEAQFHSGELAMLPHGVPASLLGSVANSASTPAVAAGVSLGSLAPTGPTGAIACSTCHHEHRGADAKLAVMDNGTCQACHAVKFQSFRLDHPEFHQHLESAAHPILFSHATHRDQHFGNEKFECAACHTPSRDGRVKTAAFEFSCARCHGDHFNGKAEPSKSGIVLLQIPALDLQTLAALKVDVGQWPHYDGDPPVRLTPFLRLLLGGDRSDYLAHLPPDLGQLADAKDDQIIAVQQLAWAIKSLFNDAQKDVTSLHPLLSSALAAPVSDEQFAALTAGLSSDDLRAAARQWFPQLSSEMQKPFEKWNPGIRAPKSVEPAPAKTPETKSASPASDDLFNGDAAPAKTPSQPPAAHPAVAPAGDDLFNGDSPAPPAPKPAVVPSPPAAKAPPAGGGDDLFNGDVAAPASKPAVPPAVTAKPPSASGDDLFNGDVAAAAPTSKPAVAPAPVAQQPKGAGGDDLFNGDTAAAPASKPAEAASAPVASQPPAPAPSAPAAIEPAAQATSTPVLSPDGWERDDERFALIYHPSGHANLFLRGWLEALSTHEESAATPWQTQLLSAEVGGACTKCHASVHSGTSFDWSSDSKNAQRNFVKFTHTPHLLEPRLQSCSACHALPQGSDALASIDPISGFKLIQKQSCSACHAPHLASDSCLTCHNYHVTPPVREAVASESPAVALSAK